MSGEQISALLGQEDKDDALESTSDVYAHVDPHKMKATNRALTKRWDQAESEATRWRADQLLAISKHDNKILTTGKGVRS